MGSQLQSLKHFTFLFFVIASQFAFCQGISSSAAAETTYGGLRIGCSVGYSWRHMRVAAFYQTAVPLHSELSRNKATFLGIDNTVNIVTYEKLSFAACARVGIVNRQFLVITPGIRTAVRIFRRTHVVWGMHWRYSRPAHELMIQYQFFKS